MQHPMSTAGISTRTESNIIRIQNARSQFVASPSIRTTYLTADSRLVAGGSDSEKKELEVTSSSSWRLSGSGVGAPEMGRMPRAGTLEMFSIFYLASLESLASCKNFQAVTHSFLPFYQERLISWVDAMIVNFETGDRTAYTVFYEPGQSSDLSSFSPLTSQLFAREVLSVSQPNKISAANSSGDYAAATRSALENKIEGITGFELHQIIRNIATILATAPKSEYACFIREIFTSGKRAETNFSLPQLHGLFSATRWCDYAVLREMILGEFDVDFVKIRPFERERTDDTNRGEMVLPKTIIWGVKYPSPPDKDPERFNLTTQRAFFAWLHAEGPDSTQDTISNLEHTSIGPTSGPTFRSKPPRGKGFGSPLSAQKKPDSLEVIYHKVQVIEQRMAEGNLPDLVTAMSPLLSKIRLYWQDYLRFLSDFQQPKSGIKKLLHDSGETAGVYLANDTEKKDAFWQQIEHARDLCLLCDSFERSISRHNLGSYGDWLMPSDNFVSENYVPEQLIKSLPPCSFPQRLSGHRTEWSQGGGR